MLDFSKNGLNISFDITDEGKVVFCDFSKNPVADERKKDPRWCSIAEIHVNGQNPDDHHFGKHTGGYGTYTLKYVSHKHYENKDGDKLEFVLSNKEIEATVHYQMYNGIGAISAYTEVKNISDKAVGLEYVSSFAYSGFDTGCFPDYKDVSVLIPHNAWCIEANWREYTLSELGYERCSDFSGKRISVSNTGTFSCKEYLPMGAITNKKTDNTFLWQIENNGSWQWEISDIADMLYLKLSGPTEQENQWYKELLPGQVFTSVKVSIAIGSDFNDALAELTKYRRKITREKVTDKTLPVIFNDYMNCLMGDPTEEKEIPLIDKAKELGAEYFCIDAGWYADGTWWDMVGEWLPCHWRFPRGIHFILDYIRSKGMIPGLWLEIEVMGINCPLADKLPDDYFFVRHGRRVIDHGRYQLDFRNPKVREFATEIVDRLVTEYGVGYIKNDYNIEIGVGTEQNADSFGDGLLMHNRAYLSWANDIRNKYPALVWENCSSGGMRMEYASLSVADIQSVSDQTDYTFNCHASAAASTAVLPEQGAIWSYPKAKDTENAFIVNMVNSMLKRVHLSGEVFGWNDNQVALVRDAIKCYKSIRQDIPVSVPFYPLGIPKYTDDIMCEAYYTDKHIRMAVWRMETDISKVKIPLSNEIKDAKIIYPSSPKASVCIADGGVEVTLSEPLYAVIIELSI